MNKYINLKYNKSGMTNEVNGIVVDIDDITSFVPLDPANTDYANIMKLVEEGKLVIQPADEQ